MAVRMVSGRQREFDKQEALYAAMQVFWKKGYIGASLTDLCQAMGINKPSMYAAFGNKASLFIAATDYYLEVNAKSHLKYLEQPGKLSENLLAYVFSVVSGQCEDGGHKGCFISLCVSESASNLLPPEAEQKISFLRDFGETSLCDYLSDQKAKGFLHEKQDPNILARLVITLLHGTAAMARGGSNFDSLTPVIRSVFSGLELDAV